MNRSSARDMIREFYAATGADGNHPATWSQWVHERPEWTARLRDELALADEVPAAASADERERRCYALWLDLMWEEGPAAPASP